MTIKKLVLYYLRNRIPYIVLSCLQKNNEVNSQISFLDASIEKNNHVSI